ncbi:MAG: class I SAM-dependent methyltransferase [Candidatus Calescibacterium sp.]|nr:class I SAM-dependent methyltransferase [Candidatus Calescibacterium sp.]
MKYEQSIKSIEKLILESIKNDRDRFLYEYFKGEYKRHIRELDFLKNARNGKILEIGADPYHFTGLCKLEGIDIISLDIHPDYENHIVKTLGLKVIACNIETEKMPFEEGTFDVIMFNEVFEHLRINPIATLKEINRVLKPGGILYLTTPNMYMIRNIYRFVRGWGLDDPYYEFNKLNEVGYMGHVREYARWQIVKFLSNTGFEVEKIMYHNYDTRRYLRLVYALIPCVRTNICVISRKKK